MLKVVSLLSFFLHIIKNFSLIIIIVFIIHYNFFYSLYFLANISYFILLLYITRLLYGCLLAKDHPELRCQGDCVFRLLLTRLVVQDKYDVYVFLLLLQTRLQIYRQIVGYLSSLRFVFRHNQNLLEYTVLRPSNPISSPSNLQYFFKILDIYDLNPHNLNPLQYTLGSSCSPRALQFINTYHRSFNISLSTPVLQHTLDPSYFLEPQRIPQSTLKPSINHSESQSL